MDSSEVTFVIGGLITAYCLGWGMGITFLTFKTYMEKIS